MAFSCKKVVIETIGFWARIVKTIFCIPNGVCKYYPSCTDYAKSALVQYPLHKAIALIVKRILKCNPFSKGGYDPLK